MLQLVKVIMVVLGCHIAEIQHNRISTAINYVNNQNNDYLWFLTGGVKDALSNHRSEASQMADNIVQSNVVLDNDARNTAENFVNLKKWIKLNYVNQNLTIPNLIITTSSFHKDRAELIFNGVFHDLYVDLTWNLAPLACTYCWHDEKIHLKNVYNDVQKALKN